VQVVLTLTLVSVTLVVYAMAKGAAEECERQKTEIRESYGPDIRHCFLPSEERELWDCIRNEKVDDNADAPRSTRGLSHQMGDVDGDAQRAPKVRKDI
jgi:hypothetical protein